MRKLRLILLATAVVIAVGGAMATKSAAPCSSLPQFYKYGENYYPAGILGYDYQCQFDHFGGACTYYFDTATETYKPCKYGKIVWIR